MKEIYGGVIGANENALKMMFGQSESLCCNETLQFEDYDKVVFSYFDPEERRKRHRTVFPQDCRRAFRVGARLVKADGYRHIRTGEQTPAGTRVNTG